MKRIEQKFKDLRAKNEKALIIYLTAGDPSLDITKKLIFALDKNGADILEIGVPFSDPTADGPIIQAASQRALKAGTTLDSVLKMVTDVRKVSEIPIVLFGYFNPIFAYGMKKFARDASKAGVDGVLVVDLPYEEAKELRDYTDTVGIDFISLIAPTTGMERLKKISAEASGFLYCISITGITGTAAPKIVNIKTEVEKIRNITRLPIAVGFGISKPEQAKAIGHFADGVVIGSTVVRMIDDNKNNRNLIKKVVSYVCEVKNALR